MIGSPFVNKPGLVFVVVVVACSKKESPSPSATPTAAGSGSAAAAPVAIDAAAAAAPIDASLLGDLPALVVGDADKATIEASVKLNTAGYELHKKKQWTGAADKYREAVTADPGNLLARYNLASVYASSGEADKALAALAQFKVPDCRACAGILLHAATDSEWKALHADSRFKAIVGDVAVEPFDMKMKAYGLDSSGEIQHVTED